MEHPILLKEVKKKGNSLILRLDKPERHLYHLKPDMLIEIQIIRVIHPEKEQVVSSPKQETKTLTDDKSPTKPRG